jgi:protein SCO1/2
VGSMGLAAYSAARLGLIGGPEFHGTTYPDAPPAPLFTLTNHRGTETSLADYRGQAVLLFFGYTQCPDVCPLTLARVSQLMRDADIGPEAVTILFVTVDPDNDTPDRLAEYVSRFGPHVVGLTGDALDLQNIFAAYGVYASAATDHDGQPILAHTSQLFGIDSSGRLRVLIHGDSPLEEIEEDIRTLVRGG